MYPIRMVLRTNWVSSHQRYPFQMMRRLTGIRKVLGLWGGIGIPILFTPRVWLRIKDGPFSPLRWFDFRLRPRAFQAVLVGLVIPGGCITPSGWTI